jgi:Pilin accessory protein (PilO)
MAALIIEIRRRKYVCGLFWQSLSQPRELKAEAVELARKLNFDLLVLRKDLGVAQAGFASTREGAHKGMLSLGAIVATALAVKGFQHDRRQQPATSWLGAFRLDDDRWAYFAVRDESFLPQGDFAGTRAEVLERLYADYGLGGWSAVIGDPELAEHGFHHFNPVTLDDILPQSQGRRLWLASAWELVPVERSHLPVLVAGGVAVLAIAIVAALFWYCQREAEERLARERAMLTAQQRLAAEQATLVPPPPWLGRPAPSDLARACSERLELLSPGGWRLDEYTCTETQRSYAWSRADSNVSYLLEHAPGAVVELGAEKARLAEPMSVKAAPNEEAVPASQLLPDLASRFQQLGLRLAVKAPAALPQPAALPGVRQFTPPVPLWRAYAFSLQSDGLPLVELASALSQPAVRVKTMTYRQGEWFVEGVAYAK